MIAGKYSIAAISCILVNAIGCGIYFLILKNNLRRWQKATILLTAVISELCFLHISQGLPGIYIYFTRISTCSRTIFFSCAGWRRKSENKLYFLIQGFVNAELISFIQWQMYTYLRGYGAVLNLLQKAGLWFMSLLFFTTAAFAMHWQLSGKRNLKFRLLEITPIAVVSGITLLLAYLEVYLRSLPQGEWDVAEMPMNRLLFDLAGLAVLYIYRLFYTERKNREEIMVMEMLMENQFQQYQAARDSVEILNRKYHDFKHQIEVLRTTETTSERNAYLDELESGIASYEAQNHTGNKVLDTILTSKELICTRKKIKLTKVVNGTLLSFMDTMDICSIFGNALENAIEYEEQLPEEKRLIHLSVSEQKGFVLIQVENYFEGTLTMNGDFPATSKGDKAYHGFGVKSISRTAEKYGGTMTCKVREQWFEVRVLIPME